MDRSAAPLNAERLITALAILKVNADRGSDYIDYFVPFVAECLRQSSDEAISLATVRDALLERFGMAVPLGAVKTILRRAARRGYVRKDSDIYWRNPTALAELDLESVRDRALREETALVESLRTYAQVTFGLVWDHAQSERALLAHLERRSSLLLVPTDEALTKALEGMRGTATEDFVVSRFALHISEFDPEAFGYLETIVKGSALASVLFFPELSNVGSALTGLTVYLDTRVLLRALGLEGPAAQEVATELLDLTYSLGGRLACFHDTYVELRGVLGNVKSSLRVGGASPGEFPGSASDYMRKAGASPSDMDLRIGHVDGDLAAMRVAVRERPPSRSSDDQEPLRAVLRDEVRHKRENALEHDAKALDAIIRIRDGQVQYRLETARAVFVTTNTNLARAGRLFAALPTEAVPIAFSDVEFVTLIWLKRPVAAPDLPTKQIIANSYAGLFPSEGLWQAYLNEIERLREAGGITVDDYYILRYGDVASTALMDLTVGDYDAFSEGTVREVLERAQAAARGAVAAKLDDSERTVQRMREDTSRRLARRTRFAARTAKGLRISLQVAASIMLGVVAWIGSPALPVISADVAPQLAPVLAIASAAVVAFVVSGVWSKVSLREYFQGFEVLLTHWLARVITRLVDGPVENVEMVDETRA